MGRLLMVRHGETVWNHQGRIQGIPMWPCRNAAAGRAERLAARLADNPSTPPIAATCAAPPKPPR